MPTRTFYNLPEEKREKLLAALRDEFARVPYGEVSINRIVQSAGISRGSFYQYFEDKADALKYLLSDYVRLVARRMVRSLEERGGDLPGMFVDTLDFTVDFVTQAQTNAFCKNVFSDSRITAALFRPGCPGEMPPIARELYACVSREAPDLRSEEEFYTMLGILFLLTGEAVAQTFFDITRYPDVRAMYIRRLGLIARGFLKNKEAPPCLS